MDVDLKKINVSIKTFEPLKPHKLIDVLELKRRMIIFLTVLFVSELKMRGSALKG